jgi:probable F420-dependent oxidoreductase
MNFGCHLPTFGPMATRANLLAFSRRVEELGFDSLWASDHVVIPTAIASRYPYSETGRLFIPPDIDLIEPLTALTFVAAVTERVRLGTSVMVLPHRHPVLAAKMLACLDHLSGGRVVVGAGIGWMREEIEILGVPFSRRAAWSEEAVRIMRTCWREGRASHRGAFFAFDEVGVFPRPVRGDIPIWIGGHTAPALRRVVALGDGWHVAGAPVEQLSADLDLLREECLRQGRAPAELALSVRLGLAFRGTPAGPARKQLQGTPEEIIERIRQYRDLGVETVILETRYRDLADLVGIYERFAREIRPAVA